MMFRVQYSGILSVVLFAGSGLISETNAFGISSPFSSSRQHETCNSKTRLDMATWSDSKAVKEYQNFLESGLQTPENRPDGPSVIVRPYEGMNLLAEVLVSLGTGEDVVLAPDEPFPYELGGRQEYPIYITLPPYHIEPYLQSLTEEQKERNFDFAFFSGNLEYGNIEEVLKEYGYCRDPMTQVLLTGMQYRMTQLGTVQIQDVSTRLGTDAVGEEKWAGECSACGKWNFAIAERLARAEVRCKTDFYRDWRRKMWERNMLDVVFNLIGAVRDEPTTVAQAARYYDQEASDMLWEISQSLRGWKAMTMMFGFEERMFGHAENIGSEQPCTLVDWMFPYFWGNRVYLDSPMVLEYLWYAKEQLGLIPEVELPPKKEGARSGIMRQGNLRADGVV